ncbi:hypothetical protein JCM3766R1_001586, partial [Sporobolomyces carnicolor]
MSSTYNPPRRGPPLPPPPPPPPAPSAAPSQAAAPAVGHTPSSGHSSDLGAPTQDVDDDVVLESMDRPGFGRRGRFIEGIKANTFKVAISEAEKIWWKYECVIATVARTRSDGTSAPSRPLPKNLLWRVWNEIQTTHAERFGRLKPAFDGGVAIYTNRQLPSSPLIIEDIRLPDGKRGTFMATFKNPIPIPLASLFSYISSQPGAHIGEVFDALQALNVLFRHTPSLLFSSTRTSFYPLDLQFGSSVKLQKGIQLWRGFFQSVRPSAFGLQLNLDTTSGAYVQAGNLLDLVLELAGLRDPRLLDISSGRVQGTTILTINRLLRKVRITIDRGQQVAGGKDRFFKRDLAPGCGLKLLSARSHRFECDGRMVSVEEFFRTTYGTRLQYPDVPLLEIKKGVLVPIELVTVDPGNKWNHRLSPEQIALASRFQILEPGDRLRQILKMRQTVLQQRESLSHLSSFGVTLAPTETQVPARILPPPQIEYHSERARDRRPGAPPRFVATRVADGAWKQNKRGPNVVEKFVTPNRELRSAVVILARPDMMRDAPMFFQTLFRWCEEHNVAGAREGLFMTKNNHDVGTVVTNAIRNAEDKFGQPPQIMFWLFDRENSDDYDKFKYET